MISIIGNTRFDLDKSKPGKLVRSNPLNHKGSAVLYHAVDTTVHNKVRQIIVEVFRNRNGYLFSEIRQIEAAARLFRKFGYIVISDSVSGKAYYKYKNDQGLWWYYLRYTTNTGHNAPVNFVVIKNYSNKLNLYYRIDGISPNEPIDNYLDDITIDTWNDKIKLKKTKKKCRKESAKPKSL